MLLRPMVGPSVTLQLRARAHCARIKGCTPCAVAGNNATHPKVAVILVDHGSRKRESNELVVRRVS